ncbi:MAG: hypothetical protein ABJN95_11165 [Maribacter sp.]|uniref:hypothetical protein n=1 Tax=Maribacter sp. TaxID=1897614 RepID=UPI0032998DAF
MASQLNCNKTIHFVFDEESKFAKIEWKGDYISFGKAKLDYKKAFRESIEELNMESNAKLKYKNALGFPSDSIIQVVVRIEKVVWGFGLSSALMETELVYKLPERKINIIGNNKVYMAGNTKRNLFKTLKHGNYQLLSIICDE